MHPSPASRSPVIDVRHLMKRYGDFTSVKDLTFQVQPGAVYGFLGPNGAGKTTTLRILLGVFRPTAGSISVLGAPSAFPVRHRVGYLPEEKGLYRKMRAADVIAYFGRLKGLDASVAKQRAVASLERYGLGEFIRRPVEALSKGMAQKVQLLATLVHDPELVILDEPFSGLDPVNQELLEEIIRDLARRERTVLFSTHIMEHAERLCDRILIINRGQACFEGTLVEARATLPRRVRIQSPSDMTWVGEWEGVVRANLPPGCPSQAAGVHEFEVRPGADPQVLLSRCIERGVRLERFEQVNPSLHEVFVHSVKASEIGGDPLP